MMVYLTFNFSIMMKERRIAVVLAGCGVYDGAEIHEAVATLLAIDNFGASYECFAPDIKQFHVINHLTGEEINETRNVLIESARIARGNIKRLREFNPADFDAIIFPGGFGVAKNLCTFAIDGPDCLVNPIVEKAIKSAYEAKLPIGALCISPALIAKVLGNITITIGTDQGTASAVQSLGATHKEAFGSNIVIDTKNKIVTSPCYMLDSPISIIFEGARNVLSALFEMMD
jgi:enhancing lycopene biosynthesis protein 2